MLLLAPTVPAPIVPVLTVPVPAVAVATEVPPADAQLQRRPTEAPVAVVFTPPQVGQIIRVDMSTSSSRIVRSERAPRAPRGSPILAGRVGDGTTWKCAAGRGSRATK